MSETLLRELIEEVKRLHDTIRVMQQDINCIRNGEYDEPQGATPKRAGRPVVPAERKTSRVW